MGQLATRALSSEFRCATRNAVLPVALTAILHHSDLTKFFQSPGLSLRLVQKSRVRSVSAIKSICGMLPGRQR
jgi:hypothetical protein